MKVPDGLEARGVAFWTALHEKYEFDGHELLVAEEVCRTLDTIVALEAVVVARGPMVKGSQGQEVLNPAIVEVRQQRLAMTRLLNVLGLDDAAEHDLSRHRQAVKAASARWKRA